MDKADIIAEDMEWEAVQATMEQVDHDAYWEALVDHYESQGG